MKKNNALKTKYAAAISEISELHNTLADLVPFQAQGLGDGSNPLSNFESLALNNRYSNLTINRLILSYLYTAAWSYGFDC